MIALLSSVTAGGTTTAGVLAGLLWLPFARAGRPRHPRLLWVAMPLGAILFLAGVFWIQVPLQALGGQWLVQSVPPFTLESWPLLVALPLALLAALVQESARWLAVSGALRVARGSLKRAPWTGALAGAGIGFVEATWLLGSIPPAHFSLWSAAVLERLLAIAFHIGAGALIGGGIATGHPVGAFTIAVLLHTAVDSGAALYQMGRAPYGEVLWLLAIIAGGLYSGMLVATRRRSAPSRPTGA